MMPLFGFGGYPTLFGPHPDGSVKQTDGLESSVRRHEGVKLNSEGQHIAYLDSEGVLTGGVGHNLIANKNQGFKEGDVIPDELVDVWLKDDLAKVEVQAPSTVSNFNTLPVGAQEVVKEMVFQLGLNGVLKFKKMRKALEAEDFELAAKEMLDSKWAKQTPSRAKELAERMGVL